MTTANLTIQTGSIVWELIDGRWMEQRPEVFRSDVQGVRTILAPRQCAVCFAPTPAADELLCHDCAAVVTRLR